MKLLPKIFKKFHITARCQSAVDTEFAKSTVKIARLLGYRTIYIVLILFVLYITEIILRFH